jgi:hypothetical protein
MQFLSRQEVGLAGSALLGGESLSEIKERVNPQRRGPKSSA